MATYSDGPTANSTTSGSTLAITGVTAAIGDLLVLFCAADNAGTAGVTSTSTSITDAAGNTWTSQTPTHQSPGNTANDGTDLSIWTSLITATLTAATITINFSPNTTSKAAAIQQAVPAAGCAMVVGTVGPGVTGSGNSRTSGLVSVALGTTMIGACAIEAGPAAGLTTDSDATNGSWSTALTVVADTGTGLTSQTLTVQRKTVSATGNQTYNTSTSSGRDSALNYLLVHEAVDGTLAATDGADTAAFESNYTSGALAATDADDTAAFVGLVGIAGTMAATDAPDTARFIAPTSAPRAGTKSVRILVRFDWPDAQITRLWAGNGAFIDSDGDVWRGAGLITGIDELERAVNGEAPAITVTLSGLSAETSGRIWTYYQAGNLIDAEMAVLLQACDDIDQPVGDARIVFTGFFSNAVFDDAGGDDPVSAVSAEIINKFTLRRLPNWAVLSDADQKARSAVLNPLASPDRFAERVPLNENKTVTWPRF